MLIVEKGQWDNRVQTRINPECRTNTELGTATVEKGKYQQILKHLISQHRLRIRACKHYSYICNVLKLSNSTMIMQSHTLYIMFKFLRFILQKIHLLAKQKIQNWSSKRSSWFPSVVPQCFAFGIPPSLPTFLSLPLFLLVSPSHFSLSF